MATPLLTLDTLIEAPTVVIDGVAYPLVPLDAMPITEHLRLQQLAPKLDALWKRGQQDVLTPEDERALETILKTLCQSILQAPDEVHARLTDMQRFQIYQAFLGLPRPRLLAVGTQPTQESTRTTGGRSRRGFNGSTAAPIPRPGSRGRPASSGRASR